MVNHRCCQWPAPHCRNTNSWFYASQVSHRAVVLGDTIFKSTSLVSAWRHHRSRHVVLLSKYQIDNLQQCILQVCVWRGDICMAFFFFFFFLREIVFWGSVLLCSPSGPGTFCIASASLKVEAALPLQPSLCWGLGLSHTGL